MFKKRKEKRGYGFNLLVPCFVLLYTFTFFFLCFVSVGGLGGLGDVCWSMGDLCWGGGCLNLATSVLTWIICTVCQNGLTHVSMKSSC